MQRPKRLPGALNAARPQRVTWRHRSRDHSIPHMAFPIGAPVHCDQVSIFKRFRDIRPQHNVSERTHEHTLLTHISMDCAVEVDGSVVNVIIGVQVGECRARFWGGRSLSNYHMARRRGCLWVEPLPCGLHVSVGEPRLLHLRTVI